MSKDFFSIWLSLLFSHISNEQNGLRIARRYQDFYTFSFPGWKVIIVTHNAKFELCTSMGYQSSSLRWLSAPEQHELPLFSLEKRRRSCCPELISIKSALRACWRPCRIPMESLRSPHRHSGWIADTLARSASNTNRGGPPTWYPSGSAYRLA